LNFGKTHEREGEGFQEWWLRGELNPDSSRGDEANKFNPCHTKRQIQHRESGEENSN
jgi:hypothetical protein